jgi:hypothetical protein
MCHKLECSSCLVAYKVSHFYFVLIINSLNAELNPICHFLALLGAHHILHVNRIRVNIFIDFVHVIPLSTVVIVAAAL